MVTGLVVAFLLAHGVIHAVVYAAPPPSDGRQPFNPRRSWALERVHVAARTADATSVAVAWATAAMFVVAALGAAAGATWWGVASAVGAIAGLVLKVTYFNRWLTLGLALDAAVLIAVAAEWPPSLYT